MSMMPKLSTVIGLLALVLGAQVWAEDEVTPESIDFGISAFATGLMKDARENAELQQACAEDLASCLAAREQAIPEDSDMTYAVSEDGQKVTFTTTRRATRTISMAKDGGVSLSDEGGVTTRAGYCPYADQFLENCFSGTFPENCLNSTSCTCSGANRNTFPCTNYACSKIGGSCTAAYGL